MEFFTELWVIWIIVALIFAVLELATNAFTMIWFAIGAILACIFDLLNVTLYGQLSVFLLVSFILILYTRPLVKKFLGSKHNQKTNLDSILDSKGSVTVEINPDISEGQVKIRGEVWSAVSKDGEIISINSIVKVEEIRGVKVVVSKVNE
ncbi:MAG TPA: NfeD family protein [Clostridiales bacterium]|nr:MAG: hypothetical protein A2Y22_06260 [Clostridiales bacterium GWD2_32_59]HAN09957.1 NfeD family protein [Clostridiales bacterium]